MTRNVSPDGSRSRMLARPFGWVCQFAAAHTGAASRHVVRKDVPFRLAAPGGESPVASRQLAALPIPRMGENLNCIRAYKLKKTPNRHPRSAVRAYNRG